MNEVLGHFQHDADSQLPPDVLSDVVSLFAERDQQRTIHEPIRRNPWNGNPEAVSTPLVIRNEAVTHLPMEPQIPRASTVLPPPAPSQAAPPPPPAEQEPSISCPICLESIDEIKAANKKLCSTVCGHVFCMNCLEQFVKHKKQCPTCRKKLSKKQYHPIFLS